MADDNEGPFANFVPSTEPPGVEPPKDNNKKGGGKKKAGGKKKSATAPTKSNAVQTVVSAHNSRVQPAKAKKARKPRAAKKAPRAMKVDPLVIFGACAGMGLDDVPIVARVMEILQKLPKKSRQRVVQALAKIFA